MKPQPPPTEQTLTLPKHPRHKRFVDLILQGKNQTEAYMEAGYPCSKDAAISSAARLRRRPDVDAYLTGIRAAEMAQRQQQGRASDISHLIRRMIRK